jgi:hypothetical protein
LGSEPEFFDDEIVLSTKPVASHTQLLADRFIGRWLTPGPTGCFITRRLETHAMQDNSRLG